MHPWSVWWSGTAHASLFVQACADTSGPPRAHLRLAGELDLAARSLLADTATWTAASVPVRVLIDLEGLTFADSMLAGFLAQLCGGLPRHAEVILWRAHPAIDLVLSATGLPTIATVSADPSVPAGFICREAW